MSDKKVIKLDVPEHLRTGKVYEALKEQTMSKVYKQDPKLPQGKWIDDNQAYIRKTPLLDPAKSVDENYDLLWQRYAGKTPEPRSFQEVADAMYDTPEATPSPDTEPSLVCHMCTKKHAVVYQICPECYGSLTAAQAEIQRLREELKIIVGICSSDTLPRKEQS